MANIVVTGAAGSVGRVTIDALENHTVTAVTHREYDDIDSSVVEIADYSEVERVFEGHDIVIHLAANPSPRADWNEIFEPNIIGAYNVYEAALNTGVERVVFASTNHVQQMYNVTEPTRPGTTKENPQIMRPETPNRPDSYYGVSKVFGEALGNYYADRYGIEVINLRIGYLLSKTELREKQAKDERRAHYVRAQWLSPDDCRDGIKKAATQPLDNNPFTCNLLSANQDRYFTIIEMMRELDYEPKDNANEVLNSAPQDSEFEPLDNR